MVWAGHLFPEFGRGRSEKVDTNTSLSTESA